jgi:hypothetical protein
VKIMSRLGAYVDELGASSCLEHKITGRAYARRGTLRRDRVTVDQAMMLMGAKGSGVL